MRKRPSAPCWRARYERRERERGKRNRGGERVGGSKWGGTTAGETRRDGEEKTNEREHCFALARPSTTGAARRGAAGPGPSRLNAVKLSSYSHKGNSLSQPVKYKRVFPAGRFSTPIVFWAGLLFSVALRHAAPRRAAQPCQLLFPLTTIARYY